MTTIRADIAARSWFDELAMSGCAVGFDTPLVLSRSKDQQPVAV